MDSPPMVYDHPPKSTDLLSRYPSQPANKCLDRLYSSVKIIHGMQYLILSQGESHPMTMTKIIHITE
jgi:hypothetical protein